MKNKRYFFRSWEKFTNAVIDLCIIFSPSALYIQTLECSTLMCINSYCSDTAPDTGQDIQTLVDQNYLLCVVPQVLLLTWGTLDAVRFRLGLFWLGAFFETKISRKTFCTFLSPLCLFFQRTQSSGHKKEKYLKVRSKSKGTATRLGENPLEPALLACLQPCSPCRSVALDEMNLQWNHRNLILIIRLERAGATRRRA